jgi:anti-sigma factor RsiW
MTICEQLSERMPAVALGTATWSAEEETHLAGCPECRKEWKLVSAAADLGHDVAAGLDSHHVTERVLGRLRADRGRRARRIGWVVGGLAAAAAMALVVRTGGHPRAPGTSPGTVAEMPLPELDSLRTPELQAVLDALDAPLGTSVQGVDTGELEDLDAHELQHVLDGLEG